MTNHGKELEGKRTVISEMKSKTRRNTRVNTDNKQRKWTWLVSMRMWVPSPALLSGLRILCRCELWWTLQTWLGSCLLVAGGQASRCSSEFTPSLGTSICLGCSPKKPKKKKKKRKTEGSQEEIFKNWEEVKHGEQTCGCQGGGGRSGMDWEFGVSGWKLFHLEWIKQWGPTVQHRELYPITCDRTWWKVVWEKEYVCVWLSHFCCTAEIGTTLQINHT